MSSKAAALRFRVEAALAGRIASPFEYHDRRIVETVSAGIPPIDLLTGGLPRGSLTEICGPPCSGRTSLLISALASRTAASEVCALVDARDAFDPHSAAAAGVRLKQLLWVRCRNAEQAFRAADLLIQGSGFGLIALDLSDVPPREVRHVPLQVWFRFRRAVEYTPTIFVVLEQESNAKTCASLVLRLGAEESRWSQTSSELFKHSCGASRSHAATSPEAPASGIAECRVAGEILVPHSPGCLLGGSKLHAEMICSRVKREGDRLVPQEEVLADAGGRGTDFETQSVWKA